MKYTRTEIEAIQRSCIVASEALGVVAGMVSPGVTTAEIDEKVESFILSRNAIPAFKGYRGFPASICASINEEVVHGIPKRRMLKDGDVISVDVGVLLNGFYGDTAFTFPVGTVDEKTIHLLAVTRESLNRAVDIAVVGRRIGAIGHAVQSLCESEGFNVVRNLAGHGVGRNLHELPEVPNFGTEKDGDEIEEGMVFAIEPMVNVGGDKVLITGDGWTVRTMDRRASAHFEHTVAIIDGRAECLTTFDPIDKAIKMR